MTTTAQPSTSNASANVTANDTLDEESIPFKPISKLEVKIKKSKFSLKFDFQFHNKNNINRVSMGFKPVTSND